MKKLIALTLTIALFASTASTQTLAKEFNKHNNKLCVAVRLAKGCTAVEYAAKVTALTTANLTAEPNAKVAIPTETFYATKEDFRDAEVVAPLLAKRTQVQLEEAASVLVRAWLDATPDQRVAACTALPKIFDPEICR